MRHARAAAETALLVLSLSLALASCGRGAAPSGGGAAGGSAGGAAAGGGDGRTVTPAPATASVASVARADDLVLDGTLVADEESQVTPIVAGRVMAVHVERGSHVEPGDPLVTLRDVDYRLQARNATAAAEGAAARLGIGAGDAAPAPDATPEVRSAAATLALAEESFRRAEELSARGVLSAAQRDEARANVERAREAHAAATNAARASIASLESARAALASANTALRETRVTAPFAGEVAERHASVGEYVALATPLVTLVRTDPMRLELRVPQASVASIARGQAVSITFEGLPGRTFAGEVRYVSAAVRADTRSLTVEAVVPNSDGALRPGMFGTARVVLGTSRSLAAVPESAVLTAAGVSRAFVVRDGVVEERVLRVVDRRDGQVLVEDGLAPGETVATERLDVLGDGVRIGG